MTGFSDQAEQHTAKLQQAVLVHPFNEELSAGTLAPLTPSQLNERLLHLQEIYPPQAFYAMMNLLDSHDTSRAMFMLDANAATSTTRGFRLESLRCNSTKSPWLVSLTRTMTLPMPRL